MVAGVSTSLAPMWDDYGCHILLWCVDMVVCGGKMTCVNEGEDWDYRVG